MQLVVNLSFGVMVGVGLFLFGVPNALLWGVLGALLRFVPYVGPWLSAVLPILLTAAVFPGWSMFVGVIIMFICIEFFSNMVMEPWLYGSSSGISSLGVVVATVFWAWLWGPVGLILAMPMTVCLIVIGKHVPQLAIVNHLFGTESTVPTAGRLYHWMLVGDDLAASEMLAEERDGKEFAKLCDDLLIPVLAELKHDEARGTIALPQMRRALRTLELALFVDAKPVAPIEPSSCVSLVCIPAKNEVDECAARLLAAAAIGNGLNAEVVSSETLASEAADRIDLVGATHAAVVQVAPFSPVHVRRFLKLSAGRIQENVKLFDVSAGAPVGAVPDYGTTRPIRQENSFSSIIARVVEDNQVSEATRPTVMATPALS